ncbi:WD repeat-containing protein 7-like isoform X2 [Panonychus citri]|uniref:WD repeat-containing protein 7-like isoform X2 n=1 Tax=Panonychus citri TaxID=50023 RepID=UPI0023080FC5|nr:WD repeat-containing protein 7-like isoform X2 [Panonychus citri]
MPLGLSSQLIIPITLWGNRAPTHCISCVYLGRDLRTLVTGCNDGQLLVWDSLNSNLKNIQPRCMLFGHSSGIMCISSGSVNPEDDLIISSSEDGEMCLWDLNDGQCLESTRLQYIHTHMQIHLMQGNGETRLFCNGYYAEILIINPITLQIMFTLSSRVNPDWISAIDIVYPGKPQDNVIGLTVSGFVKVWILTGNESRSSEPIYEQEFKQIKPLNALKLTCNTYNQSTVLVVCAKYWQIYDAHDFSLLFSIDNKRNERWAGGEFLSAEKILVWSDSGRGYIYQLPKNCIPDRKEFHEQSKKNHVIDPYCILTIKNDERLLCPPVTQYHLIPVRSSNSSSSTNTQQQQQQQSQQPTRVFIRGDSLGRIAIWFISNEMINGVTLNDGIAQGDPVYHEPDNIYSLTDAWKSMKPRPLGIMDQLNSGDHPDVKVTASVFLPMQGTLIVGREDGTIIIVPATQTLKLQLLHSQSSQSVNDNWPQYQVLYGHSGKVTCLLYPHHVDSRYQIQHLVSGGVDFSVCLWDLYAGTLLYRFSVHAGEITQLLVPPKDCSSRILSCICSVASDHSVALLSLKENKCIMLASRHMFPVSIIKWRPLDDYMVVGCVDGSVYVWQIETGLLDRVVQGMLADDILSACDDHQAASNEDRLTNPAIHLFRGLKSRNLDAIRHATARGIRHIAGPLHQQKQDVIDPAIQNRSHPLMIQSLKTNPKDQDSHVLAFDVESLIVNLLADAYTQLDPETLENRGLTNNKAYQRYIQLVESPESSHKFWSKVKDSAESAAQKIQAKAESVGFKPDVNVATVLFTRRSSTETENAKNGVENSSDKRTNKLISSETDLNIEISQILLSLLHGWGLDIEMDGVCESKLGLLRPVRPICFGVLSKGGHMSLYLPTFLAKHDVKCEISSPPVAGKELKLTNESHLSNIGSSAKRVRMKESGSMETIFDEDRSRKFYARYHWELSTAMTTTHLLTILSLARTLMSMNNSSFIPEGERKRRALSRLSRSESRNSDSQIEADMKALEADMMANIQEQSKQGWKLLAGLHCVFLPELVKTGGFKKPLLDILAKRWQDRCLKVREAAQTLLLAELRRIGARGRKQLVDDWASYLCQVDEQNGAAMNKHLNVPSSDRTQQSQHSPSNMTPDNDHEEFNSSDDDVDDVGGGVGSEGGRGVGEKGENGTSYQRRSSSGSEIRRKQSTAIILLGVIGSEYGEGVEPSKGQRVMAEEDPNQKKSIIEGFGAGNYTLARHTSRALAYLVEAPPSTGLPAFSALRRAAIDLLGRGFIVWEPYLDVTKVLYALLELCCDADNLIPTMSFGLPLTPAADSCRTARQALSLIATSRPGSFITTLAREVARYNNLQQNAQSMNVPVAGSPLNRAKPEILRNIELLIEKSQHQVSDLIIETIDIILHCLDPNHLKSKELGKVFPPITRFPNVTCCTATRRIAVGAKNGNLAIYELRAPKPQLINAHAASITCCSFSHDGKHLVSYSMNECKLAFWSTATSLFGLGNSQTKCVKTFNTPPNGPDNVTKLPRLLWVSNKTILLVFPDGRENKFTI